MLNGQYEYSKTCVERPLKGSSKSGLKTGGLFGEGINLNLKNRLPFQLSVLQPLLPTCSIKLFCQFQPENK